MKKYLNKLVSINFKDKKPVAGIILDFNDEWILMKYNVVDYIIDGYTIVKNKNIKKIEYGEREKWTEKILILKKYKTASKAKISLTNLEIILNSLTKNYGVFTLYTKEEGVCWLGRLNSFNDKKFTIDDLTPRGKWEGQLSFRESEIRTIEFDTDYINSLKLVTKKVP